MAGLPVSRLEGIAPELREKIYQQLFTGLQLSLELRLHPKVCSECGFAHDVLYTARDALPEADYHSQRSILQVNSEIRVEALPVFRKSIQELYISGDYPYQYNSLTLVPTCGAYCLIPSTLLRANNIKSLVLGENSERSFILRKMAPEVLNLIVPSLSCFPCLESITVVVSKGVAGVMHGAARGVNWMQLRLRHLCNNQIFLAQVGSVFRDEPVDRLHHIFNMTQTQSRNEVRVSVRQDAFISDKDLGHEEPLPLLMQGVDGGEYMKFDIELQQTDVGGFRPVRARFVPGESHYQIEDDPYGDDSGATDVVEASYVLRCKTNKENKLPSSRSQNVWS